MQIIAAGTQAAPGSTNEDLYRTGAEYALVLDGAGRYPGEPGGCHHPVTWIVSRLGEHIADRLSHEVDLGTVVRDAIEATVADHGPGCDLTHPLSPGATGAIVRVRHGVLQWFVLGDCAVVMEHRDGHHSVVIDDRVDRLRDAPVTDAPVRTYTPAYVATIRNRPGGFWVLGAVPAAAAQALTGHVAVDDVARVLICSDGASRLTERYGATWSSVLSLVATGGAPALIAAVRDAEHADPDPRRWRGKRHDDATVVLCRPGPDQGATPDDDTAAQ